MTDFDALPEIKHWRRWLLLVWLVAACLMVWYRWAGIHWYSLPDTDDNMRMAQVRALLNGQGWYDLRQYKLNPPAGFNIHWSRLVDLPIAGLELMLRPFLGYWAADRWAAGLAPLIPMGVALAGITTAARRLIAPNAWVVAAALYFCCGSTMLMMMPLRVDHHGWQLAMLAWTLAGLADPNGRRGGAAMGLSSAISLTIGLELLPFLAVSGAAAALRWMWDADEETPRLRGYALTLAAGCALGYILFATYDNRVWRCDVLSPVWLSTMVSAATLAFLVTYLPLRTPLFRLVALGVVGAVLAGGFAKAFPQCLGAPEQISPELYSSWFSHVREAKPLYAQSWTTALTVAALPVAGVIGSLFAARRAWGSRTFPAWATVAFVSVLSLLLCFWQTRNGPGAQLIAVPGAAALIWTFVPFLIDSTNVATRVIGTVAFVLVVSGLGPSWIADRWPGDPPNARIKAINRANARCPTLPALRPIAALPTTTIFTFVDLGPRLINTTHHKAVAGPYHRNGDAILDVHHAFDGAPDQAHAIMLRHGATLLLTCPNLNESTVYRARSPNGFYSRLARNEKFAWLTPVPLPTGSPYLLWRISR
ncbi:AcrB/AcrD/AcrF family protein [Sphingomonas antarctica]|uniref:AcrB/AcrD/AcrF family protein n=1 Tax=Sphingomonas antarctica TaxID=2040274 RepID=UPI0039EC0F27